MKQSQGTSSILWGPIEQKSLFIGTSGGPVNSPNALQIGFRGEYLL